jgi:hypothetical protein
MNGKSMYQMDEKELQALIAKQEHLVAKLNYERPGSPEYRFEAGILKDAKQLLDEKRKKPKAS